MMRALAKPDKVLDVKSHILDTGQRLIAARGFSAVGLNEILLGAGVPKGSFYHYFASKDVFGSQLLDHYFEKYLSEIDSFLFDTNKSGIERLAAYWRFWRDNQERDDPDGKCLAVKLGAEVSDMSEGMRIALKHGTSAIIGRLARVITDGLADGSILSRRDPEELANTLYQLWLGASVMSKIARDRGPFDAAETATEHLLKSS